MDGYTVEEAASVLGVPRERVWELIARGVLSGAPDLAGAMRVRLRADAPQPPQRAQGDAPPADTAAGATGASFADPSPFRELLTEFRGLTERYGQALLALGEARGEVAGLRSRVEMLEARVDLRLTGGTLPTAEPWSTAPRAATERTFLHEGERDIAPPAERESEDGESDEERSAGRRRAKGGRRATEAFAEALARADDPNAPELPGARDAAAAWAALRDAPRTAYATDAALPRELPAADDVPVAEEEPPQRHAAVGPEAGSEKELTDDGAEEQQRESAHAASAADAAVDAPHVTAETTERDAEAAPEAGVDATNGGSSDAAQAAAVGEAVERQPPTPPGGEAREEPQWADDRYTTEIEEPAWFTAEELGLEPASEPEPTADRPDAPMAWPRAEAPPSANGEARDASPHDSASRQLDEGLAALDALAHPDLRDVPQVDSDPAFERASGQPRPPSPAGDVDRSVDEAQPSRERSDRDERTATSWSRPARESSSPGQMRPASRAYRRLRRIFPG